MLLNPAKLLTSSLFVLSLTTAAMAQNDPPRVIETIGSASVSAAPDIATIRVGVERTEKTSAKAFNGTKAAMNELIVSIKAQGVDAKDITTSGLSLSPFYEQSKTDARGRPQISGYTASVEISVVARDIGKTGALLDTALKEGSNQFNGILYDLSDKKPALDEARKQAAAEAKRKAELLAGALSLKLGPVVRVYEPAAEVARPYGAEAFGRLKQADAAPLNVEPGEIEISAQVGTVWMIAP